MKFTIGTRGSTLALRQVEIVTRKLQQEFPKLEVELKVIKTAGDRFADKPLVSIKEKGIFSKTINEAVLQGEVSFAIHSMKDLPTELPKGTAIVTVPERASPYDALVSLRYTKLNDLPAGAVVGTSSPRRRAQLLHVRNDLTVKPIRGNVDTRLRKLAEGLYDALVLAEAGLLRLNKQEVIAERLSPRDFTPSAGQGALAVISVEHNEKVNQVLRHITHAPSMSAVFTERAFVKALGGGCKVPMGVIANLEHDIKLYASVLSPNGEMRTQISKTGDPKFPEKLGSDTAHEILAQGAAALIKRWR